ncbi:uncharacterized protein VTP21DRAFT_3544 [Calcarisporiella thermophila]|uniref:uncharacterized protein n=1 Tax=Calcarisporiella thermophila TaxID=911321 RepID=UPI0037426C12
MLEVEPMPSSSMEDSANSPPVSSSPPSTSAITTTPPSELLSPLPHLFAIETTPSEASSSLPPSPYSETSFHPPPGENVIDKNEENTIRETYNFFAEQMPRDLGIEELYSLVDRYGFVESSNAPLKPKIVEKETERGKKWERMTIRRQNQEHAHEFHFTPKFISRVYKGIPDCWRADAWHFMLTNGVLSSRKKSAPVTPEYYLELLQLSSTHEHQIDLDIPRTMQDHMLFRTRYGPGQRNLFNILRAFSNVDPEVGYCQGMSSVVSTLLLYFIEEDAFAMLVHLFRQFNLRFLFLPGFPMLLESFYLLEQLLKVHASRVARRMQELTISSSSYATRWLITLFTANVVDHQTQMRVWDIFMLNGFDVLLFVSVGLLKTLEPRLLQMDFDEVMSLLNSRIDVADDDRLIGWVKRRYTGADTPRLLERLRNEYQKTQS